MYNKEESTLSKFSYVNKDFGAIYTDLLDLATKLTNKWHPANSNESDPGVVLLKEGAFIADHLNYNTDKNILEAFLPTATQESSVRNMVQAGGYIPNYYVSARGNIQFVYRSDEPDKGIPTKIPSLTLNITNTDGTISYVQVEPLIFDPLTGLASADFMEGYVSDLEIDGSTNITIENIDDDHRLYLPTTMIAQNGVFIRNSDLNKNLDWASALWQRENFLSTLPPLTKAYQLEYDSDKGQVYIEFPSDINELIGSGLNIKYIVTSGLAGNVPANTLSTISSPETYQESENQTWNMKNLTLNNASAIENGKNPETIEEMYHNFKEVVGTFDTLVTCRDYSNAIRQLEDNNNTKVVSNAIVTDSTNDYNNSLKVVSLDQFGTYIEQGQLGKAIGEFKADATGRLSKGDIVMANDDQDILSFHRVKADGISGSAELEKITSLKDLLAEGEMSNNDLKLGALIPYRSSRYDIRKPEASLEETFKPVVDEQNTTYTNGVTFDKIVDSLSDYKCISTALKDKVENELYYFKVKTPLDIQITTYNRITQKIIFDEIKENVYRALTENFNASMVEFGENLDLDKVYQVVLNSDERIKNVYISPREDYTQTVGVIKDTEETTTEVSLTGEYKYGDAGSTELLVDLVAKNVLAGRLCLFNFISDFDYNYGQQDNMIIGNITGLKTLSTITAATKGARTYNSKNYGYTVVDYGLWDLSPAALGWFITTHKNEYTFNDEVNNTSVTYALNYYIGDDDEPKTFGDVFGIVESDTVVIPPQPAGTEVRLELETSSTETLPELPSRIKSIVENSPIYFTVGEGNLGCGSVWVIKALPTEESYQLMPQDNIISSVRMYEQNSNTTYDEYITDFQNNSGIRITNKSSHNLDLKVFSSDSSVITTLENEIEIVSFKGDEDNSQTKISLAHEGPDNHYIHIAAPNLYSTKIYPVYTYYRLKTTDSSFVINGGEEVSLPEGTSLELLLSKDGSYTVTTCPSGTIVKSSFDIYGSDFTITDEEKKKSRLYSQKTGTNSQGNTVTGYFMSITAGNNIEIKEILESKLTQTLDCYWIRANNGSELFTYTYSAIDDTSKKEVRPSGNTFWFDPSASSGERELCTILNTGEYFIYTNKQRSTTAMFGPGTLIKIPESFAIASAGTWGIKSEDLISFDTLSTNGFNGLSYRTIEFSNDKPLSCIETTIITLNKNCQLSLEGLPPTGEDSYEITNTWKALDADRVAYTINDETTEMPRVSSSISQYKKFIKCDFILPSGTNSTSLNTYTVAENYNGADNNKTTITEAIEATYSESNEPKSVSVKFPQKEGDTTIYKHLAFNFSVGGLSSTETKLGSISEGITSSVADLLGVEEFKLMAYNTSDIKITQDDVTPVGTDLNELYINILDYGRKNTDGEGVDYTFKMDIPFSYISKGIKVSEAEYPADSGLYPQENNNSLIIPLYLTGGLNFLAENSKKLILKASIIKPGEIETNIKFTEVGKGTLLTELIISPDKYFYLLSCTQPIEQADNLNLILRIELANPDSQTEYIIVDSAVEPIYLWFKPIKLYDGVNPNIADYSQDRLEKIINRMNNLVKCSNISNLAVYYINEPDNTLAIQDDNIYIKNTGYFNPDFLFDKNNIANQLTLPMIDLKNSSIYLTKSVQGYRDDAR